MNTTKLFVSACLWLAALQTTLADHAPVNISGWKFRISIGGPNTLEVTFNANGSYSSTTDGQNNAGSGTFTYQKNSATVGVINTVVTSPPQYVGETDIFTLTFSADSAGTFTQQIFINGNFYLSRSGTFSVLTMGAGGVPPVIVQEPVDYSGPVATPFNLTVTATGTAPLAYLWSQDGWAYLDLTAPTANLFGGHMDGGNWQVVVSNSYGSATSRVARVSMQAPAIFVGMTTTNGKTTLVQFGAKEGRYRLEASENLIAWQPIATNTVDWTLYTTNTFNTNSLRLFFRSIQLP